MSGLEPLSAREPAAAQRRIAAAAQASVGKALRWVIWLAVIAFVNDPMVAHSTGESYFYLQVYPESLSGRFEIALSDLNPALGLSGTEGEITKENLDERIGFLHDYFVEHVQLSSEQGPLAIEFTSHEYLQAHHGFALLSFDLTGFDDVPDSLTVDYSVLFDEEPSHSGYLLIEHNWATGTFANENQVALIFRSEGRRQRLELTSSGRLRGFMAILVVGLEHMLFGFDHAMFLIALLLPAVLIRGADGAWQPVRRFKPAARDLAKLVAAYIVGCSLTLALAALGALRVPERAVEVAIAFTVGLAATNILVPLFRSRSWMVVLVCGGFHGLGFATLISDLGVVREAPGLSFLAFDLGIAIGVLLLATVLFPVLFLMRKMGFYRKLLLPAAALVMAVMSCVWMVERALGLDFLLTKRARLILGKVVP
jgi:hypothetical protein